MENRDKIKEAFSEQIRMWRDGRVKTENGECRILDQKVPVEDFAEGLIQIIETLNK